MPVILARASQQAAGYRPEGGVERCGYCRFFVTQGTCNRILGPVSPRGWCRYFSRMVYLRLDSGTDNDFTGAAPGATLDMNFMSSGNMPPGVTFTRASTATYFNATGTMQTAAVNVARWDYNPMTLALNGLLIEEARTNVLLNSVTLGTQSVAVTAQAYTLSFYGAGTITKSGTATGALVGTGAFPQRVSQTFTPTAGTLTLTVTGTVQNAQLEAGAFPTSYIPTTGAAATRSGDAATIPVGSWFVSNGMTLEAEMYLPTTGGTVYAGIGDGATFGNSFYLVAGQAIRASAGTGSSTSPTAGAIYKIAGTLTTTQVQCCANGGTVGQASQSVASLTAATIISIGTAPWNLGTSEVDGHMRRIRYWPRVLTNTELQSVTT